MVVEPVCAETTLGLFPFTTIPCAVSFAFCSLSTAANDNMKVLACGAARGGSTCVGCASRRGGFNAVSLFEPIAESRAPVVSAGGSNATGRSRSCDLGRYPFQRTKYQ